jgi:hypothetical protein
MSNIRTPLTVKASDRLAQLVQEGKIVPKGAEHIERTPVDGRVADVALGRGMGVRPQSAAVSLQDEIKESARACGGLSLEELTVIWRPGSIDDMVSGGGNTHLRAIRELARELPARRARVWPLSQAV